MPRGFTAKTPQALARARELRADGHTLRAISDELGLSISTVGSWFTDPEGKRLKERKRRYLHECADCGGACYHESTRCQPCDTQLRRARSEEWLTDRLHTWIELYGTVPSATDWNTNPAFPAATSAINIYGSWSKFIEAVGYPARGPGEHWILAATSLRPPP